MFVDLSIFTIVWAGLFFPMILAMALDRTFVVILFIGAELSLASHAAVKLISIGDHTTGVAVYFISWLVCGVVAAVSNRASQLDN